MQIRIIRFSTEQIFDPLIISVNISDDVLKTFQSKNSFTDQMAENNRKSSLVVCCCVLPWFLKNESQNSTLKEALGASETEFTCSEYKEVTTGLSLLPNLLFNSYKKNLSPLVENTCCSLAERKNVHLHLQAATGLCTPVGWTHASHGARLSSDKRHFKPGCNSMLSGLLQPVQKGVF